MKTKLWFKYLLFIYILAISSWEYFYRVSNTAVYLLFPIALFLSVYYRKRINTGVLFLLPFVAIFISQVILYSIPYHFPITLFVRLFTIYLVASIIGKELIYITINSIKFIAVISLVFYVLLHFDFTNNLFLQLSENFNNLGSMPETVVDWPNFMIYTITPKPDDFFLYRNSGPFREPGLYVIFLNIALFLNMLLTREIINKINFVLVVSVISTFSTTGYLVILLIFLFFIGTSKKLSIIKKVIMLIFVLGLIPIVYSLPFVGDKIQEQSTQSDISYSRFGAFLVHLNILRDFPLTGLPYDNTTYFNYADNISPNGISEVFIRFGYVVGFYYYYLLFRSSQFITQNIGYRRIGFYLFLVIFTSLFSQTVGTSPIILLFVFSQFSLINNYKLGNYKSIRKSV